MSFYVLNKYTFIGYLYVRLKENYESRFWTLYPWSLQLEGRQHFQKLVSCFFSWVLLLKKWTWSSEANTFPFGQSNISLCVQYITGKHFSFLSFFFQTCHPYRCSQSHWRKLFNLQIPPSLKQFCKTVHYKFQLVSAFISKCDILVRLGISKWESILFAFQLGVQHCNSTPTIDHVLRSSSGLQNADYYYVIEWIKTKT